VATITLSLSERFKSEIKHFSWVNWSEVAREEVLKRDIFERYIKTGKLSDEDWKFCERIDWHPVDELPLKESFVKRLQEAEKGSFIKLNSVAEIFE
jgi:hypothetical protein